MPGYIAVERQALQKVLDDLSSLDPARYEKHLAVGKSGTSVKAWLDWLNDYRRVAAAKGGKFSVRQEIGSAAVFRSDGTDPSAGSATAVVTVKVLVRDEPRKPLRCLFRKGDDGWKLVEQKLLPVAP